VPVASVRRRFYTELYGRRRPGANVFSENEGMQTPWVSPRDLYVLSLGTRGRGYVSVIRESFFPGSGA
jgi:hypothetical protein